MRYWLFKTEPSTFSITDLERAPQQTTQWEGVRNYQARNYLRDEIKCGDLVFIYHSVKEPIGIVGLAEVTRAAYPDYFQFDPESKYYDRQAQADKPRWFMVDVQLREIFPSVISLSALREYPELEGMVLLQKGSRLSIQPVQKSEAEFILTLRGILRGQGSV